LGGSYRLRKSRARRAWGDPRRVTRSTKQTSKREAERTAAKWEAELQEGLQKLASNVSWQQFRKRLLTEHANRLSEDGLAIHRSRPARLSA
jgi:hypothetical protein